MEQQLKPGAGQPGQSQPDPRQLDKRLQAAIAAIARGDHGDPFSVLGLHPGLTQGTQQVRVFLPDAQSVRIVDLSGTPLAAAERVQADGFWIAVVERGHPFAYRLRVDFGAGEVDFEDAYRFGAWLGDLDVHLLAEGTHLDTYKRLGAHPQERDGVAGTAFAVWAPNARRVSVVGDFCNWDGRRLPMRLRHGAGVWEIFVPGVTKGRVYKYEIRSHDGALLPLKSDPMGFAAEHPPRTASVVHGLPRRAWHDNAWLSKRGELSGRDKPISIYEVHLGSWRRRHDGTFLSYAELADQLVPYVRALGFTHIELLPVSEFPFDGSWGYQPIGLFAPTSRFGSPEDFMGFIERCHENEIGVLLDWVPGHFPSDPHGLGQFDGTHLYEHADPKQGYHPDWNTLVYNYGRAEVANFLTSNALFWLDQYHVDGLRVDAVASMLYLDYSRQHGQWVPNRYGGNENLEAIQFLKRVNELAYGNHPGAITAAEESTAWPGVSRPTYLGGLGFGFKWNMGWMHDTLRYFSKDPIHRRYHHNDLTFGLLYAFSENFILPLSHDEVVHGKGALLAKMPGDRWQKFANLRAYYAFMWSHPGKKLLFMGGEIAQEREWNHDRGLDWFVLDQGDHQGVQHLIRDLNGLYRALPALHQLDCEPGGFEWIEANDSDNSVLAFLRRDRGAGLAVTVCNLTPVPRPAYRVGVPEAGWYAERINTDAGAYGGSNLGNGGGVRAEPIEAHGRPFSLLLTLPPLATLILERQH